MPVQNIIAPARPSTVEISLEPAQNAIYSLALVKRVSCISGLAPWVTDTAERLSRENRRVNDLVMDGLFHAAVPSQSWPSFPAYLKHLRAMEPVAVRDKMLDFYLQMPKCDDADPDVYTLPLEKTYILASVENYINFLRSRFSPNMVDAEIEAQAYTYAIDPQAMQELIVSHLEQMWNRYLAQEWERVLPMLQDSVRAFQAYDYSGMSEFEIAQTITGQKLDDREWKWKIENAERLVYIPNAHIGPYIGGVPVGSAHGLVFGARLPEGTHIDAPDLSRAEMLVRLNALADDTRLRVLKLVADHGEQRSQDIMNRLDLSQSASSRHLKQLSATGYLNERRCESAKCYSLNPERLEDTLHAIRNFLLGS